MAYLLHIESSSTVCSVALSEDNNLIGTKEMNDGYTHAENLHVFINEVLSSSGITARDLSAISVSSGPGSYTGLRIGFSTAKGLAYALQIPLISISTLQAMAYQAKEKEPGYRYYCPMIDARRMEVYCGIYNSDLSTEEEVRALVLDENSIRFFEKENAMCCFGDGMPKAKDLLRRYNHIHFLENYYPSAKSIIALAWQKYMAKEFSDVAYAEPFYLKDFFFSTPKK